MHYTVTEFADRIEASTCAWVKASAKEPGAEKPEKLPEKPGEATEYPLEEDRRSLEPPGQET